MSGTMMYDRDAVVGGASVMARPTSRVWVKFRREAELAGTAADGKPIFRSVDLAEFRQPGETDVVVREVRHEDTMRYPDQWAAFKAQTDQRPDGIPLAQLFPTSPHVVKMMEHRGIFTVEMLADLAESGIQKLGMGARQYVSKAQTYLDVVTQNGPATALQAQIEKQEQQILAQEQMIASLQDQMAAISQRTRTELRRVDAFAGDDE